VTDIHPAHVYAITDDLCILTTYFNPNSYQTKLRNYERFRGVLERSHLPLFTVECAFGDQPFSLQGPRVLRLRTTDVMWQKERMINIGVSALPQEYTKIAWLDCDILFENPMWAPLVSQLLDRVQLVQPFDQFIRLPRGDEFRRKIAIHRANSASFAAVYASAPTMHRHGDFLQHGHTGFAWAARRDLLEKHGLYDACIAGSGDHMIAHAACGDWESPCVLNELGFSGQRKHFRKWASGFFRDVQGRMTFVPGSILHLWHGEMDNRRYAERTLQLASFQFDPEKDIRIGSSGLLEWNSHKPALHRWAVRYFSTRKEDGVHQGRVSDATAHIDDLDGNWRWADNRNPVRSRMSLSLSTAGDNITGTGVSYGPGPFGTADSITIKGRYIPSLGAETFRLILNFSSGSVVTYSCLLVGPNELQGTWTEAGQSSTVIFDRDFVEPDQSKYQLLTRRLKYLTLVRNISS